MQPNPRRLAGRPPPAVPAAAEVEGEGEGWGELPAASEMGPEAVLSWRPHYVVVRVARVEDEAH
jgi:hypothetical protein